MQQLYRLPQVQPAQRFKEPRGVGTPSPAQYEAAVRRGHLSPRLDQADKVLVRFLGGHAQQVRAFHARCPPDRVNGSER